MADSDVIKTIIAEALGDGDEGMTAVAYVIANRAASMGLTPAEVVQQKGQFAGYSNPGSVVKKAQSDPDTVARVERIWESVRTGSVPDPTSGGTKFHAARSSPDWASAEDKHGTVVIGNQTFYKGATPLPKANIGESTAALLGIDQSGIRIVDITKGGKVGGVDIPANPFTGWKRGDPIAPWTREAAALQPGPDNGKIGGIVFHHTGTKDFRSSITAGQNNDDQKRTGAQYYIDRDGTVYRYAADTDVMQNVTTSKFRTDTAATRGLNNQSIIGIEMVASNSSDFTPAQKKGAAALGASLAGKYDIAPENIIGHGAIQGGKGGNKEADEGMVLADLVRAGIARSPSPASMSSALAYGRKDGGVDPMNPETWGGTAAANLADLSYTNQGAKRNLEVSPDLETAVREGVTAVYGPDYQVKVMSGAQGEGSNGIVGTRRHTTGVAADIWVYSPDGKKLTGDQLVPLSQHWLATKTGGVGFPAKAGQSLHLDLVGGSGPGAVPREKGEGALWYYGSPTKSQREALAAGMSGTVPKYAADLGAVSKGTPARSEIEWKHGVGLVYKDTGQPLKEAQAARAAQEAQAALKGREGQAAYIAEIRGEKPAIARAIPPLPRRDPRAATQTPPPALPVPRPSTFPARPSVIAQNTQTSTPAASMGRTIAQIGQEADNARLSGYRSIQEMGPSSKGAPVKPALPMPGIPGEYLGGAGGAGIAGQVQLPHDVRPSVTIPKMPDTPSVPQYIPQTVRVPNPAWTAPSGMAVNSSGQVMSQSALDAIRGVPANSYQKPVVPSANMRGTNRTPGMAQYLTKTRMVANPAYVAPQAAPPPKPGYQMGDGLVSMLSGGQNKGLGGLFNMLFGGNLNGPTQAPRSSSIPLPRAPSAQGLATGDAIRRSVEQEMSAGVTGINMDFAPASVQNSTRWQTGY